MSFRFLHAADIHLDSPLLGLKQRGDEDRHQTGKLQAASRTALENMVGLAIERAVDFVLIAGDLFDGPWKDLRTGLFFATQMERLNREKIPVFIVRGNHDAQSDLPQNLPWPNNIHIFGAQAAETDQTRLAGLKVAVHGQSFPTRAVSDNLARAYPAPVPGWFNIGLLHTALNGRQGHDNYAPCTVNDLVDRGYDYWALGHVHGFEQVSEAPAVVFPGNLQGRHVRETGPKGCVLVSVSDSNEITSVEHVPCDVVRWADLAVDISGLDDYDTALDQAKSLLEQAVEDADGRLVAARLRFQGVTPLHARLRIGLDKAEGTVGGLLTRLYYDLNMRLLGLGENTPWIESIRVETTAPIDPEALKQRHDALSGLLIAIDEISAEKDLEDELLKSVTVLKNNIGPFADFYSGNAEGVSGEDPLSLLQAGDVAGLIAEARDLILSSLTGGASDEA